MRKCKPKKCTECKHIFEPRNSLTIVCSYRCALERVNRLNEQKIASGIKKEQKARSQAHRARKQALKSKSDWLREAQTACNAYIRERDKNEACISCKREPKKRNAGHFKSVGAYPEIRFHPYNIHLQCEHCNSWKSGNVSEYRPNLIEKIRLKNVEWLEGPHEPQNLTIEDIQEIKAYYREQLKIIKG